MTDRDRLIELHHEAGAEWDYYLDECLNNGEMPSKTYDEFHADYLLANGVRLPIMCKDCEHWIYWADEKRCSCDMHFLNTKREDYCSFAKLKEREG